MAAGVGQWRGRRRATLASLGQGIMVGRRCGPRRPVAWRCRNKAVATREARGGGYGAFMASRGGERGAREETQVAAQLERREQRLVLAGNGASKPPHVLAGRQIC